MIFDGGSRSEIWGGDKTRDGLTGDGAFAHDLASYVAINNTGYFVNIANSEAVASGCSVFFDKLDGSILAARRGVAGDFDSKVDFGGVIGRKSARGISDSNPIDYIGAASL